MELREMAERVLFGNTLEEKLLLSPKEVSDDSPGKAILLPDAPGRLPELQLSPKGVRAGFPSVNRLTEDYERAKMLHFLANHELLATELMALVLLRFPEAPQEFRMGIFQTMKEEQAHTLMYMRRMKECGMHFGELPLNNYFWRIVAPMEEPMDFVTRLSLIFEQANLDFSKHYATLFHQVGDTSTAKVLEHIYRDEIEHVGHGLKWFRRWKNQEESDWQAFQRKLVFPLSVSKAKGLTPFNREGREVAGLDHEFILHLEAFEKSRGRTPNVHWFNPNGEGYEAAARCGSSYEPKKKHKLIESDFDILPFCWARKDDVVLVQKTPSLEHILYLRTSGFIMPEWVLLEQQNELQDRKIGGVLPWMWSPDSRSVLKKYSASISENSQRPFCKEFKEDYHSRKWDLQLAKKLGQHDSIWCESVQCVEIAMQGAVLLKSPYSSAGRGLLKPTGPSLLNKEQGWIKRILSDQSGIVVEPYFDKVLDFSAQYERHSDGRIELVGMTRVLNDPNGRYMGCYVHTKWAKGLPQDLSQFLFRDSSVMEIYRYEIVTRLEQELQNSHFIGAFGIDAMVYKTGTNEHGASSYQLRKIVEINMRMTMGRVALELLRKSPQGNPAHT